ncbi:hypothetical protein [Marinoscillum furvescens]|uniref:Uncharacterized protein n=1 Tax=Marinoscillum furvescens DSM 4134 TaxID=1122208 RepID=A0A3D9L2I1_MARFU|nr:hypothetical protein [Marinoscillum furvescens]RED97899.1 hypothetical protein C7460_11140 [Marinoscillum furvescens DSM 4134]
MKNLLKKNWFAVQHLTILLIISLTSCTFDFDEIKGPETEPPTDRDFEVELSSDSREYTIYKTTVFTFNFHNKSDYNLRYNDATVSVDGEEIATVNPEHFSKKIRFEIDPFSLEEGPHTLEINPKIEFYGNELAGRAGVTNTYSLQWELFVDTTPDTVNISSVAVKDGELIVSWERPELLNFDYFLLRAIDPSNPNINYPSMRIEPSETQVSYPYFLNGEISFSLSTFTYERLKTKGSSMDFRLDDPFIIYPNSDSTIAVKMRQPQLYKFITSYNIITNIEDKTYSKLDTAYQHIHLTDEPIFGKTVSSMIKVNTSDHSFLFFNENSLGRSIPEFDEVVYSEASRSFILRKLNDRTHYLYKVDENSMEVLDTLQYPVPNNTSDYGQYAITSTGDRLISVDAASGMLYDIAVSDLSIKNQIDLSAFGYYKPLHHRHHSVFSNNGMVLLGSRESIIYDINNEKLIMENWQTGLYGQAVHMSPNGEHLFREGKMYKNNGGYFEDYLTLSNHFASGHFINNSELLHFTDTTINHYDLNTQEISPLFKLNHYGESISKYGLIPLGYDIPSNERRIILIKGYHSRNELSFVMNFEGDTVQTFKVWDSSKVRYLQNHLFDRKGKAIKFNL